MSAIEPPKWLDVCRLVLTMQSVAVEELVDKLFEELPDDVWDDHSCDRLRCLIQEQQERLHKVLSEEAYLNGWGLTSPRKGLKLEPLKTD